MGCRTARSCICASPSRWSRAHACWRTSLTSPLPLRVSSWTCSKHPVSGKRGELGGALYPPFMMPFPPTWRVRLVLLDQPHRAHDMFSEACSGACWSSAEPLQTPLCACGPAGRLCSKGGLSALLRPSSIKNAHSGQYVYGRALVPWAASTGCRKGAKLVPWETPVLPTLGRQLSGYLLDHVHASSDLCQTVQLVDDSRYSGHESSHFAVHVACVDLVPFPRGNLSHFPSSFQYLGDARCPTAVTIIQCRSLEPKAYDHLKPLLNAWRRGPKGVNKRNTCRSILNLHVGLVQTGTWDMSKRTPRSLCNQKNILALCAKESVNPDMRGSLQKGGT